MKKTVYVLNIDNYQPEITDITYPALRAWCERIGADFQIITSRKFPDWDLDYEKMQIYELAKMRGDEWAIYVDSDALIHPDTPDFTTLIPKDTVVHHGVDWAPLRFKDDKYFSRDGRHIGSTNWFTMASDWCFDLWRPLDDMTPEEAVANIHVLREELEAGVTPAHLVTDYATSRNIARFGLRFNTLKKLKEDFTLQNTDFFHHVFMVEESQKLELIRQIAKIWGY